MGNFVSDSLKVFNSSTTSPLAKRVYMNLFSGSACLIGTASILPNIVSPSTLYKLHLFAFLPSILIPMLLNIFLRGLSNFAAYSLFYFYAISTGALFAPMLLSYDMGKIALAFTLTGLGFMYAISQGKRRSLDLSDQRSIFFFSLILLGLGIINLFLRLTIIELACCALGIPLCIALTSYLVSRVNEFSAYRGPDLDRLSILMSLMLLQNLVSLFIYILRILAIFSGGRRGRD